MPEHALELPADGGSLSGTLLLPDGVGPFDVAVLIAGSGPTDRDGNNPLLPQPCDSLKLLARALAARGIASLRYDKRGVGASRYPGLQESALRFEHLVDDAVAFSVHLLQEARFARLVLVGHSEGGLVAMLAAEAAGAAAVASLSAAGQPAATLMLNQIARALPAAQAEAAHQALLSLQAQQPVAEVPDEFFLLFRPTVQPYLMSWFRHDPASVAAALPLPLLLVHGELDPQVEASHARLLHAARPDARLRIVEDMDHLLAVGEDVARGAAIVADEVVALLAATASPAPSPHPAAR